MLDNTNRVYLAQRFNQGETTQIKKWALSISQQQDQQQQKTPYKWS